MSEHPPAPPDMGQLFVARVVDALMASSAWKSTALFLVYDEGGGYFDHVAPKVLETVPSHLPDANDAVGPAFRVPMIAVSPWVAPGSVFKEPADHTSILQFIERNYTTPRNPVFLPTINAARRDLADLTRAFNFRQQPISPPLPSVFQLFAKANQTVLTLNLDRTLAGCSTSLPVWRPALLGL